MENMIPTPFGYGMENEEAGNGLLPCTNCIKNCYTIHGKQKQKDRESLDGSSYFFKVMLSDSTQKLSIPPAFARKLINGSGIGGNGLLQSPSGQRWGVKICGTSTEMEFGRGWEKFVHHHAIEFGDFLMFKYICRSYFKVRIFGRSGCEKATPEKTNHAYDLQKRFSATSALRRFDGQFPTALDSDEEMYNQAETVAENEVVRLTAPGHLPKSLGPCHSAETMTEEKSYIGTYYVSRRRPVTQIEKSEALKAAASFRSKEPFCLVIMKPSFVYKGFRLSFTKASAAILQLPRERIDVTLVGHSNREWHAHYIGERYCLSGGWGYFSRDNYLEEGDVCIFERVDNNRNKIMLRVHIFRIVKECIPCKRMKSTIVSPTNHSNKKKEVSREDLSSEAFGSKQENNTKQGRKRTQLKLEKDNSGSNCLKLARCTPDISGRKECCRDSLPFEQTCNLVVCPKKELLCSPSSVDGQKYNDGDTLVPSEKAISPADVNVKEEDDNFLIIWGTNDAGNEMPPNSGALIPFEQSLCEGPLTTNSIVPVLNPKPLAAVALFPKEAICLVDTNGEASLKSGSGMYNTVNSYHPFTEPIAEEAFGNG